MTSSPIDFTKPKIRHLFATPFISWELPTDLAAQVNPRLEALILAREKETASQNASNQGGWQSDDKIMQWGGEDVTIIVDTLRRMIDEVTVHLDSTGSHRGGIMWKINGWANINRKHASNATHIHPGAYWSAVYYVKTDGAEDPAMGGGLKLIDPRGGLSLMYCPLLRVGLEGYMTSGQSEMHQPRSGECVLFPSWLSHSVMPYLGEGQRISLAFNFSV